VWEVYLVKIEPLAITKLNYRACFLRGSVKPSLYLAAGSDGNVSIFDDSLKVCKQFKYKKR
jgi:hypothetical protein